MSEALVSAALSFACYLGDGKSGSLHSMLLVNSVSKSLLTSYKRLGLNHAFRTFGKLWDGGGLRSISCCVAQEDRKIKKRRKYKIRKLD